MYVREIKKICVRVCVCMQKYFTQKNKEYFYYIKKILKKYVKKKIRIVLYYLFN